MFQEISQQKVHWDTPIPDEIKKKWIEIMTDMAKVQIIEIPRCVLPSRQSGMYFLCSYMGSQMQANQHMVQMFIFELKLRMAFLHI